MLGIGCGDCCISSNQSVPSAPSAFAICSYLFLRISIYTILEFTHQYESFDFFVFGDKRVTSHFLAYSFGFNDMSGEAVVFGRLAALGGVCRSFRLLKL